jgi:hypothetical protein
VPINSAYNFETNGDSEKIGLTQHDLCLNKGLESLVHELNGVTSKNKRQRVRLAWFNAR